jgi:hypothetical protein
VHLKCLFNPLLSPVGMKCHRSIFTLICGHLHFPPTLWFFITENIQLAFFSSSFFCLLPTRTLLPSGNSPSGCRYRRLIVIKHSALRNIQHCTSTVNSPLTNSSGVFTVNLIYIVDYVMRFTLQCRFCFFSKSIFVDETITHALPLIRVLHNHPTHSHLRHRRPTTIVTVHARHAATQSIKLLIVPQTTNPWQPQWPLTVVKFRSRPTNQKL